MYVHLGNDNGVDKTEGSNWGNNAEGNDKRQEEAEINKTIPM